MADKEQAAAADDTLNQAAAEAIESQKEDLKDGEQQEKAEEPTEQVEQEAAEAEETAEEPIPAPEDIPQDHDKQSQLGRKVTAYHRRMDELESRQREQMEGFNRLASLLESKLLTTDEKQDVSENPDQYLAGLDPDEPVTAKEAIALAQSIAAKMADDRYEKNRRNEMRQTQEYRDNYDRTVLNLMTSLTPEEQEGVLSEMTTMEYDPTEDPYRDGELNFRKAETSYLRKRAAQATRSVPTKGEKPTGTVTSQKTVPKTEKKVKLDSWAEQYLEFAERRSGPDYAKKLLKE